MQVLCVASPDLFVAQVLRIWYSQKNCNLIVQVTSSGKLYFGEPDLIIDSWIFYLVT